jgi:hypothetical protein
MYILTTGSVDLPPPRPLKLHPGSQITVSRFLVLTTVRMKNNLDALMFGSAYQPFDRPYNLLYTFVTRSVVLFMDINDKKNKIPFKQHLYCHVQYRTIFDTMCIL